MKNLKSIMILTCSMLFSFVLLAQGPPGGGNGGGGGAPIDGGISILVGGAALYGAKKVRERRRQLNQEKTDKV